MEQDRFQNQGQNQQANFIPGFHQTQPQIFTPMIPQLFQLPQANPWMQQPSWMPTLNFGQQPYNQMMGNYQQNVIPPLLSQLSPVNPPNPNFTGNRNSGNQNRNKPFNKGQKAGNNSGKPRKDNQKDNREKTHKSDQETKKIEANYEEFFPSIKSGLQSESQKAEALNQLNILTTLSSQPAKKEQISANQAFDQAGEQGVDKMHDDQVSQTKNEAAKKASKGKNKKTKQISEESKQFSVARLGIKFINIAKEVKKMLSGQNQKAPHQQPKSAAVVLNTKGLNLGTDGKKFKYVVGESGVEKKEVHNKPSKIKKSMNLYQEQQKLHTKETEKVTEEKPDEDQVDDSEDEEDSNQDAEQNLSEFDGSLDEQVENIEPENSENFGNQLQNISSSLPQDFLNLVKARENFFNSTDVNNRGTLPQDIKIRGYVDHAIDPAFEAKALQLVNKLIFRQQVNKITTPLKSTKRIVAGFNEVAKSLKLKKSKMVLFAVDIKENPLQNGTDEHVFKLIQMLQEQNIPYAFAGTRNEMGYAIYGRKMEKKVKSTCLSITNVQGYETILIFQAFKELVTMAKKLRTDLEKSQLGFN